MVEESYPPDSAPIATEPGDAAPQQPQIRSPVMQATSSSADSGQTSSASTSGTNTANSSRQPTIRLSRTGSPEYKMKERKDPQAQYLAQEQAYVSKLRNDLVNDYYEKELSPESTEGSSDRFLDEDGFDGDWDEEGFYLGGIGTSFDDPYSLSMEDSFQFIEGEGGPQNKAAIQKRTVWQSMLTSVLTGQVITSEKSKMRTRREGYRVGSEEQVEELWFELRAKVCGRTLAEQRQVLTQSRANVVDVLEKVATFRLQTESCTDLDSAYRLVKDLLDQVSKCELLYRNRKAMIEEYPILARPDITLRCEALTAWCSTTSLIIQELNLLRQWTGNDKADPTLKPTKKNMEPLTLVERVFKQDEALKSIYKNRIDSYIFPLLRRCREVSIAYAHVFVEELGLPFVHLGLEPVMAFPIKLMRQTIQLRLDYARKLVNPTMVIVDQTIQQFEIYMKLGLYVVEEYSDLTRPVLDKGWSFSRQDANSLNETLLECITIYLELLANKFLDGGRSSLSYVRSFKSIDNLEEKHYNFLQDTCRLIEGGSISVAERFTALHSRVLGRLISYWDHQMLGPQNMTTIEIERWYGPTMEYVRSIQRKLLRFYKTLSTTYENATEYDHPKTKMEVFTKQLMDAGFFLVFIGTLEVQGMYIFASPNLRDQPYTIRQLVRGYCRPRDERDGIAQAKELGVLLILSIQEPLVWKGEIYDLDAPVGDVHPVDPGRVRLVCQGGSSELLEVREHYEYLNNLNVAVQRRSHLAKVDMELTKIRNQFFKLSMEVMISAIKFRTKMKPYGCQQLVQNMYTFAREIGKRGVNLFDGRRKGRIVETLIELCVDWVAFVCDDCPPNDHKTYRWSVVALEFAMRITRGTNMIFMKEDLFEKLKRKVAVCISLMISHFDIMGVGSRASANSQPAKLKAPRKKLPPTPIEDDDALIALLRESTLEKLNKLEQERGERHMIGKVLDDTNTEFEFLNFASSLSSASIRWQQGRYIGSGAFGSVYESQNLDTGQLMAVKEVRLQNVQSIGRILKTIKDEMTVLEILSHPNVVQYYGVEVHRERVFIFMEYCEGGSLARLLEYGRIEDETVTQIYSLQMLEGLAYLHQSGVVHRDIKPENILLDHLGVIKFVDFGAAKVMSQTSKFMDGSLASSVDSDGTGSTDSSGQRTRIGSLKGTPMYMSPEVITGKGRGRHGSMDIWSIGCVILEMVTGRRPWANLDNEWAIMYHIAANHVPQMPADDQASPECKMFLLRTLERDPARRPSAMELLSDPWIVGIRNQLLYSNDNNDAAKEKRIQEVD